DDSLQAHGACARVRARLADQRMRVAAPLAVVLAATAVAHADDPVQRAEAFELDREAPPPGQAELSFDGGAPVAPWAASVQLGYLDRPMRLHTTEVKIFPIEHRQTLALGGAVSIGPSIV